MNLSLDLMSHQAEFVADTTTRNLCLVGGYGAGKTRALATKLITLSLLNPGHEGIALSPTYGMSQKVLIPELEQQLRDYEIKFDFNKSNLVFSIKTGFNAKTRIHVLAAESYKRAAGINAAFFGVDEADLIQPDLARAAWRMLSSRLRRGKVFQGCAVSTPEGFNFLWQYFVDEVQQRPELEADRRLIKASTYDNHFLPPAYIAELEAQYPEHLIKAYLLGEFVNLAGKVVYYNFDRRASHADLTLADVPMTEQLYLGMDFNYAGMSTVTAVKRNDGLVIVDELIGANNTEEAIQQIKQRYFGRPIVIHPDPAGNQRKSSASDTDIVQLRKAGLPVRSMSSHPLVKDRINSVNGLFLNHLMERRLLVNTKTCPHTTKALTTQIYDDNGQPNKKTALGVNETKVDGPLDALGYLVYTHHPLRGGGSGQIRMGGF
jgi:hypothetical protein